MQTMQGMETQKHKPEVQDSFYYFLGPLGAGKKLKLANCKLHDSILLQPLDWFFSYDSPGPDKLSKFSFLWRMLECP